MFWNIQKHTLCSKENPILLLCDNHERHVTIEAINYARDNGIVYLSFPPHTSHRLQPLDVAVFGPFKSKLKTVFNNWHVSNTGKTIGIYDIPKSLAYFQSFTAKNIINGFKTPGILPFNKLAFDDDDFASTHVYTSTERVSGIKPQSNITDNIENIPITQRHITNEASLPISTDTLKSVSVVSPPSIADTDAEPTTL